MSSPPKIEFFRGDSWDDCVSFIQAIRTAAWDAGKLRDPAWMADFASLYFSYKALSWHSKLPLDIRQDWFKLEGALVDRWAPADEGDNLQIQPAPAAAAIPPDRGDGDRAVCGFLKVIRDNDPVASSYVTFNSRNYSVCTLTDDRESALRVRCTSLSRLGLLEWINDSSCSWLAVHWTRPNPSIKRGSSDATYLTIVQSNNLKSSWPCDSEPWQLMQCTVSPSGEVTPSWDGREETSLVVFTLGAFPFLVADAEAYSRKNPSTSRAKLVVEWIK